jgi:hypothetical protein
MEKPGEWFAEGGSQFAAQWDKLRSLTLPFYLKMEFLQCLSQLPLWNRLTTLGIVLPWETSEFLSFLKDRLPTSLEDLRLSSGHSPADASGFDSFIERLVEAPIRSVHLQSLPLTTRGLSALLDLGNPAQLQVLSLRHCQLGRSHARILAKSPALQFVRSLDLSENADFDSKAASELFSSDYLSGLVCLNLSSTRVGSKGITELASAKGLTKLRSLELSDTGLDAKGLHVLLNSTKTQNLTSLVLGGSGYPREPTLSLSPDLALELTRLPNLANVYLSLEECHPRTGEILSTSESLAWPWIECYNYPDVHNYRANRAPDRSPPVYPEEN